MNTKIKWLRDKLIRMNIQGMILVDPNNIRYLTGIVAEGTFLITRKENIYITDSRYIESVNNTLTLDDEITVYDVRDISKEDYENFFLFCENVGFEENSISYSKYKECIYLYKINNFVETDGMIEEGRMIKDKEELLKIKKACNLTDKCFTYLCEYIKPGQTEKQIAFEIERYFKENGAEDISFEPIVASGPNSSMPHAVPTNRKIQKGDPITIDMGCICDGYCSDMTRTIFVSFVREEIKPIYDLVLKNQELLLEEMKEGANSRVLTMMVESDFKVNGYTLDHSIGHGVGIGIHEKPLIGRKDFLLKENMVLTNEPGIYLPGKFGVRIEDTVHILKNECIKLTNSAKNYIIV